MELKTKNLLIKDLSTKSLDINTLLKSSNRFDMDYEMFLSNALEEKSKPNSKCYFYQIEHEGIVKGIIGYDIISTLNEYKLAHLHFCGENKEILEEALNGLLEHAILHNFVIKMICHIDESNDVIKDILTNNKFIINQQIVDEKKNLVEYKITKPIYLK